ncbi:MAG TPA: polysaccharide biosynthesis protein [Cryomorphaceae bacterium]|nr:polysaccharide biosynthesis protein [Owenweeksia sp.]HBF20164.1 polysaccharide biosynthesis protein [Cryomorphaceae bacterium]HCQ14938.1 polysaccharide biosynthesis protein [Cryomorphaceae bacterium]
MLREFINKNSDRYLARWIVLMFDSAVVAISYVIAALLRFNFDAGQVASNWSLNQLAFVVAIYFIGFIISRSYAGIIRHTGLRDAFNILRASMMALVFLMSASLLIGSFSSPLAQDLNPPRSVLLIHFLLNLFFLIGSRMAVKVIYQATVNSQAQKKHTKVLIYGAGASGMITKNTLKQENKRDYDIYGFIDDNPYKVGKAIEGIMVYSPKKIFETNFVEKNKIDQIIISIQSDLSPKRKKEITEAALEKNLEVKIVPAIENWIHGELSAKQIKNVKIEDLLERDPIILDNVNISREIKGRVILVTGAAGSIGSEISRQLIYYSPRKVILLDQAESALYDLENEIKSNHPANFGLTEYVMGDVTDKARMTKVFRVFQPDIVFHAAAYKHVPLMEDNPYEGIKTNVCGTKIIADLAADFNIQKFVMVSTDKAVNPTNVMGATKRTAEIYTQALGRRRNVRTQFIITRFGNVLGSNGSVIPLFRKQIEKGGPVTITHRDITRYFMTIPEACNLVLEAGAMGNGGEIFVFDMGESVKIMDLARKMIKLSGLQVGKDIEIVEVGLRPGEKLYEELLAIKENTKPTHHPKILIASVESESYTKIKALLHKLEENLDSKDNLQMVAELKAIVPEFISNNSIFASLDLKKIVND